MLPSRDAKIADSSLAYPVVGEPHQRPLELKPDQTTMVALECLYQNLKTGLPLLLMDCVGISLCLMMAAFLTSLIPGQYAHLPYNEPQFLFNGLIFVLVYAVMGLYPGVAISPIVELKYMILGTLASGIILMTATIAFGTFSLSNAIFLGLLMIFSLLIVPVTRCLSRELFSQFHWWSQPVIIVGSGQKTEQLYTSLSRKVSSGLNPIGTIGDQADASLNNLNSLGSLSQLEIVARQHKVHWVLIAMSDQTPNSLNRILQHCGSIPNLIAIPQIDAFPSLWTRTRNIGGSLGIHVRERLLSPISQICKRLFDLGAVLVGGILMMPFLIPLLIAIWVCVRRCSPGPMLYSQERIGKGGRIFHVWKFRTMLLNADKILKEHLDQNEERRKEWETFEKLQDDPRVIPGIGQFLRTTSLDELPQLWNVFIGDMSLVGPRPFIEHQSHMYGDVLRLYHKVRPGITGLWQISGRNHTSFEDRVKFDAYYVRNWSLWMDIFILGRTIRTVLRREGAF
ncbi:MAG TPA: undecaprenyl-phosphate galactose phosphotransferase WbaP [Planctomicrobium sp.]|nr:undecaprenyl-phosphate galactose phosphotransferase WbaP [Planctomicrobium sp.]